MPVCDADKDILFQAFNDLYFFTKFILGYDLLRPEPHHDMCRFIMEPGVVKLDLEPRDCFKTTCGTIGNAIWRIIRNPDIRILISHKNIDKAREMLREIKGHFERNQRLRFYFGDLPGPVWSQYEIVVLSRREIFKEPTISIGAVDHEATSGHYDYIINDDLAGLKDMYSEAEREKTLRYKKSQIYLRDTKSFQGELNIGTRWHLTDVYDFISKRKGVMVRVRSAIDTEGKLYFPERHSMEVLKDMKDNDPVMFESQMQNNPTALQGVLYPLDKLKFYKEKSFTGNYQIGYIDPAFGKKESHIPCFFVFIIGTAVEDELYIRRWDANQELPEQNEELIVERIREYSISELYIEANAAQSEFIRNVERKLKDEGIFLTITPVTNTANKDRRIQGMHGTVISKVFFRSDWETVYPVSMGQLTVYPYARFKDAPDALAGLVSASREVAVPEVRYI